VFMNSFKERVSAEGIRRATLLGDDRPLNWRDRTGSEIDVVIEEAGALFAFEIKSGKTLASSMFDGLRRWQQISGTPPEASTLVYGGDERQTRHGMAVRPWFAQ